MSASALSHLTPDQLAAVTASRANLCVTAGAGSGKTTVLTERYAHLLRSGLAVNEIAAITFTEKAAAEMLRRIRRRVRESEEFPPQRKRQILEQLSHAPIGTIHTFCSRMLHEYALLLGLSPSFHVMDDIRASLLRARVAEQTLLDLVTEQSAAAASLIDAYEYNNALAMLAQVLDARVKLPVDASRWVGAETDSEMRDIAEAFVTCAQRTLKAYEDEKDAQQVLDFDDLIARAAEAVRRDAKIRAQRASRYKAILVDEYQDTDRLQHEVILSLGNGAPGKLFLVGDPKQSIYLFRDADVSLFLDVQKQCDAESAWMRAPLQDCFRIQPALLRFLNGLFEKLFESELSGGIDIQPLRARRTESRAPAVAMRIVSGPFPKETLRASEAEILADRIASMIRN